MQVDFEEAFARPSTAIDIVKKSPVNVQFGAKLGKLPQTFIQSRDEAGAVEKNPTFQKEVPEKRGRRNSPWH